MEEYSETEPSSEGGEFGMMTPVNPSQSQPQSQPQDAASPPRTQRIQAMDHSAAVKQNNRKSFSLFGKKSLDVSLNIPLRVLSTAGPRSIHVLTVPCLTFAASQGDAHRVLDVEPPACIHIVNEAAAQVDPRPLAY